jgi:hypothetical protein
MNNFWKFVNDHPIVSLFMLFVIIDGIVNLVLACSGRSPVW